MRDDLDIPMPSMSPGGASTTNFRVARQPEGLDANTKRMAIVAAAIVGVFVVFAGVYSFMGHRRAGVPVELHVYQTGHHGVGLALGEPALAGWTRVLLDWLKPWVA